MSCRVLVGHALNGTSEAHDVLNISDILYRGINFAPIRKRCGDSTWQSSKTKSFATRMEQSPSIAAFEALVTSLNMDSPKNTLSIANP